jgi:hypothetical protein
MHCASCSALTKPNDRRFAAWPLPPHDRAVAPAVPRVFALCMRVEQSIVVDPKSPGGINSPHGLILFDGVCVLCSGGCRFVSKRDRRGYFLFIPIQLAEVIRDAIYDLVARNRYRWFGRRDACILPNLDRSWPS